MKLRYEREQYGDSEKNPERHLMAEYNTVYRWSMTAGPGWWSLCMTKPIKLIVWPLIKVTVPVEAGNKTIQDGTMQKILAETLERLRPEAAYFFAERGVRTALYVVDVKNPSDIPVIGEPFFMGLNAAVEFTPVMNADDLKKALEQLSRK
jgi:hypothetical protein